MIVLRAFASLICCVMLATGASAQISLVPPAATPPPAASKPAPPKPKRHTPLKKPSEAAKKPDEASKKPAAPAAKPPSPDLPKAGDISPEELAAAAVNEDPNIDLVYGAYQRGFYRTAFRLATQRAQQKNDATAMTMLGELCANGQGTKRDYAKAIEWYKKASDLGDREAMFALAMVTENWR